jgi:hypothetical protein
MDLDSYYNFFEQSTFNRDTTGWHLKHFMQWDDPNANSVNIDGVTYSKHRLSVTNNGAA